VRGKCEVAVGCSGEVGITWNRRLGEGHVRWTSLQNRGKEEAGEKSEGRLGAR
jgi:hypothetical protein